MKRLSVFLVVFLSISINIFAQIVNDGGIIVVKSNSNLYLDNDIKNNSGLLKLESNSTIEIEGNFISEESANFDARQGSVVKFFGTQSKIVKSGGDDFAKIIIDKEAANVFLDDDMRVIENLEFVSENGSKLVVGTNNLILENNASINGANSNNYIQADGSGFVNKIYSGTENFTFPVGDSDEYSPLEVNITAGTFGGNSSVSVNVVDEVHPNLPSESSNCHISRYWNIEKSNINDFKATLTGTYTETDVVGNCNNIKGASYDGANWNFDNSLGNNLTITGDISNSSTDFTGMSSEALDISFISINAEVLGDNSCMISWSLVPNSNIELFEIERSTDMIGWQSIGSSIYKRTEETINKYSYLDKNIPVTQRNIIYYYRIKVIYFDGVLEYSDARFVNIVRESSDDILVFPNPTSDVLYCKLPKKISGDIATIKLIDNKGKVVLNKKLNHDSNIEMLDIEKYNITNGLYFLFIVDGYGNVYKRKVIISD